MGETTNESYKPEELNFRIPYDLGNDANHFGSGSDNFWSSEDYNPRSHKIELYNSPLVITLDVVGDLTNY